MLGTTSGASVGRGDRTPPFLVPRRVWGRRPVGAAVRFDDRGGGPAPHPALRADPRVTVLEETDARSETLAAAVPDGTLDGIVTDVSFVSLTRVLPPVLRYLKPEGFLICLIKPQFEAGRSDIGKRGVVRDAAVHRRVLTELLNFFGALGLTAEQLTYSPITGGEGNIEYLVRLRRTDGASAAAWAVSRLVAQTFVALGR